MSVSYISETILERAIVGPAKTLESATHINLQYRKNSSTHHVIRKIEKLHLIPRCRELNLSFNAIGRLENLSPLRQLRILNLSENRIRCIEGLEQLKLLEVLDLSGNQISSIPLALCSNQSLQHFRLSRNKIATLTEFQHLSPLANLSRLDVYENPCMKLPHCRSLIIFTLPTIDVLDGESVLVADRQDAAHRFDRSVINQLQEQVRAVTDSYNDSTKKLSEAEAQLHADERILSDLKRQLEKFAQREESQTAHIRDLESMLERNATTILKSQARIAGLEQEASRQQECTRCLRIESGLATQVATEKVARIEAEKQLTDMENVMNHQLKIAQGLLAAKSQRFKMEERLRSMKAAEDVNPWKTAAYSLLILCESLQADCVEYSSALQELHNHQQRSGLLIRELEALHWKRYQDNAYSDKHALRTVLISAKRVPESQTRIKLRRLISANARLRSALASERDRHADSRNWLLKQDTEELEMKQCKAALRKEIAELEREAVEMSQSLKRIQKVCKRTQTAPESDTTIASVFACRERTLLEKIRLLESELKQVTSETDQLRACLGSNLALKEYGDRICDNLLSLQRTRRWRVELQSCKSELEERDAQIRYLIGRMKGQPAAGGTQSMADFNGTSDLSGRSLKQIHSDLDSSISSLTNRVSASDHIPKSPDFNNSHREDSFRVERRNLQTSFKKEDIDKADPFSKRKFLKVIERLKEESNI